MINSSIIKKYHFSRFSCLIFVWLSFFDCIKNANSFSLSLAYSLSVSLTSFTNFLYSFFKSASYLSFVLRPDCETTILFDLDLDFVPEPCSVFLLLLLPDWGALLEVLELLSWESWVFFLWLAERESDLFKELLRLFVGVFKDITF